MQTMNQDDWNYFGGLTDGEGHIGVWVKKSDHYSMGYHVSPIFQIALGEIDKSFLEKWKNEVGGTISPNRRVGYVWRVFDREQITNLLLNLESYVRLSSTKRKIELVKQILALHEAHTPTNPEKLRPLVQELRKLSKRKRNGAIRYWTS